MPDPILPPVFALAGRRIDADGTAPPRFPLVATPAVREALGDLFELERPAALVCSAACGADLIALELAQRRRIRTRIVLAFEPARFRTTSVIDRPGDWGPLYDQVVRAATHAGDLVTLGEASSDGTGENAYAMANRTIVSEAVKLAASTTPAARLVAILVWEGRSRGATDGTDRFRALAEEAGFEIRRITTLR